MISLPGTPHLAANSCSLHVISPDVGQANPGVSARGVDDDESHLEPQ